MTEFLASRRWTTQGTGHLVAAVDAMPDDGFAAATALPGWTRAHLVAHLVSNAEALGRLVHWARTGEPTPMYASVAQRNADIEAGARRSPEELREDVRRTCAALEEDFDTMPDAAWSAEVMTIQQRTIPASQLPWLRAREVCVHLVDLDAATFADLDPGFCRELVGDVAARRATQGGPALSLREADGAATWTVAGEPPVVNVAVPLATLTAWLTGRATPAGLPDLPPWL